MQEMRFDLMSKKKLLPWQVSHILFHNRSLISENQHMYLWFAFSSIHRDPPKECLAIHYSPPILLPYNLKLKGIFVRFVSFDQYNTPTMLKEENI